MESSGIPKIESRTGSGTTTCPATRVAIQGELGSNSHMAVAEMFGDRALTIVPCGLSAEVIERLTEGQVDCAVLPIENSLHGSVAEHYDLLLEHPVRITGETLLRIQHHVIAAPGVGLSQVRRVLSHPVALSQCRRWLRAHPEIEAVPFYDTAGSVKELMDRGWRDVAGIAPERVAAEYGGEILVRGVEDHAENYTRFYLLEPEATAARRSLSMRLNKMTVGFAIAHQPGTLILALEEFRSQGMNLTRIESRPVRGRPWEYVFFVDAQFGESAQADALLWELKARCEMVKELGRFRAASHLETPFGRKSLAVPDLD